MPFTRRLLLGAAVAAPFVIPARAQGRSLRIGYQKYGTLVLVKGSAALEPHLDRLGARATWSEFPSGPALLEALRAGAIDLGSTGEAPPIFSQAAGGDLVYVAHEPPAPKGEAILVQQASPITSVAALRGRKVALNRGSNVHYLLVRALEAAGLRYDEIETVFLAPADARVAFERGQVDAWAIWDPFLAAAEASGRTRQLTDGTGLVANHQFYLASGAVLERAPDLLAAVLEAVAETNAKVERDIPQAARTLSPGVGIPAGILEVALGRQSYGVSPLSPSVIGAQQRIADTFLALGLIPRAIDVASSVKRINA